MNDQIDNVVILLFGLCASLIGHLFDVPATTLWVAAIGSSLGIAFSREASIIEAFLYILAGTLATGWAVPVVINYAPDLAQKSIAAFLSFTLIAFRVQIRRELPKVIVSVFVRINDLIRGGKQ